VDEQNTGIWEVATLVHQKPWRETLRGKWTYRHLMSVNGKFENITREDMLLEAERCSVSRPRDLLGEVKSARHWETGLHLPSRPAFRAIQPATWRQIFV
jgi:hypothetical protein